MPPSSCATLSPAYDVQMPDGSTYRRTRSSTDTESVDEYSGYRGYLMDCGCSLALAIARRLDPSDPAITKPEVTSASGILHIHRRCDGRQWPGRDSPLDGVRAGQIQLDHMTRPARAGKKSPLRRSAHDNDTASWKRLGNSCTCRCVPNRGQPRAPRKGATPPPVYKPRNQLAHIRSKYGRVKPCPHAGWDPQKHS